MQVLLGRRVLLHRRHRGAAGRGARRQRPADAARIRQHPRRRQRRRAGRRGAAAAQAARARRLAADDHHRRRGAQDRRPAAAPRQWRFRCGGGHGQDQPHRLPQVLLSHRALQRGVRVEHVPRNARLRRSRPAAAVDAGASGAPLAPHGRHRDGARPQGVRPPPELSHARLLQARLGRRRAPLRPRALQRHTRPPRGMSDAHRAGAAARGGRIIIGLSAEQQEEEAVVVVRRRWLHQQ